jgi:hypothetical protein
MTRQDINLLTTGRIWTQTCKATEISSNIIRQRAKSTQKQILILRLRTQDKALCETPILKHNHTFNRLQEHLMVSLNTTTNTLITRTKWPHLLRMLILSMNREPIKIFSFRIIIRIKITLQTLLFSSGAMALVSAWSRKYPSFLQTRTSTLWKIMFSSERRRNSFSYSIKTKMDLNQSYKVKCLRGYTMLKWLQYFSFYGKSNILRSF